MTTRRAAGLAIVYWGKSVTVRLVHRPARMTRGLVDGEPRQVEAPPTLPDGKTGSAMHSLIPIVGVMSSVVMMTVLRSGAFAAMATGTYADADDPCTGQVFWWHERTLHPVSFEPPTQPGARPRLDLPAQLRDLVTSLPPA